MKTNFSRLPSRKGVQAGASEPNCLDVESKFHSLWSAMERQVEEGIEVSRWIDKLLSFDGRLTGSEALISLSRVRKSYDDCFAILIGTLVVKKTIRSRYESPF
ncbi:hypothetical protein [Corynebacterium striatum]|uniref:hypothetical protein n=1 Tax=Corynebacterium striatum TaxID=43770 RepID=UPI00194FA6AE|nr:hypothetical protein [Corynebacterium striatum]QRP19622.1 hypothetical protein I6J27_04285 [Corynebacterium striatum]